MSLTINSDTLGKHNKAMWFAQDAVVARIQGNEIEALSNFNNALELEIEVLKSLESDNTNAETYGIILRSAANLAINCFRYERAIELINDNKSISFPDEIEEELEELLTNALTLINEKKFLVFSNKIMLIEKNKGVRFLLVTILKDISDIVIFDDFDLATKYLNNNEIPRVIIYGQSKNSASFKNIDRFIELMHRYHVKEKGLSMLLIDDLGDYNRHLRTINESISSITTKPFSPVDLKNEISSKAFSIKESGTPHKFTIDDQSLDNISFEIKFATTKRILDILVSSTLIILLLPALIIIAISIKIESKGPVIYKSLRIGFAFKPFYIYKFRIRYHPDSAKDKNSKKSIPSSNEKFVSPKMTNVGRFLRNSSLDELPQLINVLIGNMSLVGNKPLLEHEATNTTSNLTAERFLAPAGITGLWQSKRSKSRYITWEERMLLDVEYSQKNNLLYDLWILIRSPFFFFKSDSAGKAAKDNQD